jgi:hypothetical protein
MTDKHSNILDQAAKRLRAGDQRAARAILVQLLREDPENAQAWYMLSFTVPVVEKQIYALQQAVRFRPDSQKALARLRHLGGEPLTSQQIPETTQSPQPGIPPVQKPEIYDGEELLNRRLFGAPDTEPEQEPVEPQEPAQLDEEPQEILSPEEPDQPERKSRRRWPLLLAIILLIAVLFSGFLFRQQITGWITAALPESIAAATPTLETLPETGPDPTPTLAPTAVPSTPTPIPTQTPVLFTTGNLTPPDEDTSDLFEQIQAEMLDLLGRESAEPVQSFDVVEPQLQSYIYEIGQMSVFTAQADQAAALYQALGLTSKNDDVDTFLLNSWADPNGTMLLPGQDAIITVGINFSLFQQYSYAASYAQAVRQQESAALADFPCFSPTEACDIHAAVLKGGALYTASRWADTVLTPAEAVEIDSASRKYYFVPVVPSPSPLMEALRLFPYQAGQDLAAAVFQSGGQQALNQLYLNLPQTTEQVLHPEKYLAGELPSELQGVDLAGVLPEDWQNTFQGPLGEWRTFLLLAYHQEPQNRIEEETARLAAAGWDGDQAQVFINSAGQPAFVLHWQWENLTDAGQFNTALGEHIARRIGGQPTEIEGYECLRSSVGSSCLVTSEQQTIWLLAPDLDTLALLLNSYLP